MYCVVPTANWLRERVTVLRYTYIAHPVRKSIEHALELGYREGQGMGKIDWSRIEYKTGRALISTLGCRLPGQLPMCRV